MNLQMDKNASICSLILVLQISPGMPQYKLLAFYQAAIVTTTLTLHSLCPMNAATHISAFATIPVSSAEVANIPSIAFSIPDVEATAQIRLYANSTLTELACFQAVIHNGASFSQPAAISSVLGAFAILAILSSFAVAIHGTTLPQIRTHFGHSLPVLVVFEVFQTIFFSSAINLAWPSVCIAWWSNFAWSAGIIHSSTITSSVNRFVGISGNSSQVGAAGSVIINNNGGLQQREIEESMNLAGHGLWKRAISGGDEVPASTYGWAGNPVAPGLPLPGSWQGFAGELQQLGIPVLSAFLVGLIWLLVALAVIAASAVVFRLVVESLVKGNVTKVDRLGLFRSRWTVHLGQVIASLLFIAVPMMFILSISQMALDGSVGVTAIAAIIFIIFLVSSICVSAYACYYRLRFGKFEFRPDRLYLKGYRAINLFPWFEIVRESSCTEEEKITFDRRQIAYINIPTIRHISKNEERLGVHDDSAYLERFGWLTAHFRKSRWWFFAVWIVYQFVRACFIGGAATNPNVQVVGLFIVEVIAMLITFAIRPFEGRRNMIIAIYMLGVAKVIVTGLSIAFLASYELSRISATVIGLVIIAIQGLLVVALLILVLLGAASSYLSLMRNQVNFRPRHWENLRTRYYQHLDDAAADAKRPRVEHAEHAQEVEHKEPCFNVNSAQRVGKISDLEAFPDIPLPAASLTQNMADRRRSRAAGVRGPAANSALPPRSNRPHRTSLTRNDFLAKGMGNIDEDSEMSSDALSGTPRDATRRASMKHLGGNVPRPIFLRPASSLGDIPKTPVSEDSEAEKGLGAKLT